MKIKYFILVLFLFFAVSCSIEEISKEKIDNTIPVKQEESVISSDIPDVGNINQEKSSPDIDEVIGPNGCTGSACNDYFYNNPEEGQKWCDDNPVSCAKLINGGGISESPGDCGNNCEVYCDENEQECKDWCTMNPNKNPELCGFIMIQENEEKRQGDGIWEKDELTFFIKDNEQVLTTLKRDVIVGTITSQKKIGKAFLGWNAALSELNKIYPDNVVPDKIVEATTESDADIIIEVHSEREYCCDLAGLPVKGIERSTIDDNFVKLKSDVDIYNIVNMDVGFLEDITMHELGHTLGLFGHVTDRNKDLMSIISPGRGIKEGNINDLYVKFRDRIIETVDETRERDEGVRDRIVSAPD